MAKSPSGGAHAEAAAQWMLNEVNTKGSLYQEDAASALHKNYGNSVTYINDNGNIAIAKQVLSIFNKLTANTFVWERGARLWRPRARGDRPGRMQD